MNKNKKNKLIKNNGRNNYLLSNNRKNKKGIKLRDRYPPLQGSFLSKEI